MAFPHTSYNNFKNIMGENYFTEVSKTLKFLQINFKFRTLFLIYKTGKIKIIWTINVTMFMNYLMLQIYQFSHKLIQTYNAIQPTSQ